MYVFFGCMLTQFLSLSQYMDNNTGQKKTIAVLKYCLYLRIYCIQLS